MRTEYSMSCEGNLLEILIFKSLTNFPHFSFEHFFHGDFDVISLLEIFYFVQQFSTQLAAVLLHPPYEVLQIIVKSYFSVWRVCLVLPPEVKHNPAGRQL